MSDSIPTQAQSPHRLSASPQLAPQLASSPHSLPSIHSTTGPARLTNSPDGGAPLATAAAAAAAPAQAESPANDPSASLSYPPFSPLFAIVNNSSARTIHHPRVHYIFADDEPDTLDEAIARQYSYDQSRARHRATASDGDDAAAATASLPPALERAVVLDLVPSDDNNGWQVGWASSLSADWAVLKSRVSRIEEGHHHRTQNPRHTNPKPSSNNNNNSSSSKHDGDGDGGSAGAADASQDGDDEASSEGERSLMLEIEGVECEKPSVPVVRPTTAAGDDRAGGAAVAGGVGSSELRLSSLGRAAAALKNREDPAALVEEFRKRMGFVRKVVHADETRRAAMAKETQRADAAQEANKEEEEGDAGVQETRGVEQSAPSQMTQDAREAQPRD